MDLRILNIPREDGDIVHSKKVNNLEKREIAMFSSRVQCQNSNSNRIRVTMRQPMKTTHSAFLLALLLLLNACATAPQPDNYVEQIATTRLGDNRFLVDYRWGAANADTESVDLTLLRSAEIALQHGFPYFIVIDPGDSSLRVGAEDIATYGGRHYRVVSPGASNTIVCFKQKPRGFAYVALFVKASLRNKYGLDRVAEPV